MHSLLAAHVLPVNCQQWTTDSPPAHDRRADRQVARHQRKPAKPYSMNAARLRVGGGAPEFSSLPAAMINHPVPMEANEVARQIADIKSQREGIQSQLAQMRASVQVRQSQVSMGDIVLAWLQETQRYGQAQEPWMRQALGYFARGGTAPPPPMLPSQHHLAQAEHAAEMQRRRQTLAAMRKLLTSWHEDSERFHLSLLSQFESIHGEIRQLRKMAESLPQRKRAESRRPCSEKLACLELEKSAGLELLATLGASTSRFAPSFTPSYTYVQIANDQSVYGDDTEDTHSIVSDSAWC